jgi:hypothetical protein
MALSSDPTHHELPPEEIFDELMALLPTSELQVVWADRSLGAISTVDGPTLVSDVLRHTIYVQPARPSGSTVTVQVSGRATYKGLRGRNPGALDPALAAVERAIAAIEDRSPPR